MPRDPRYDILFEPIRIGPVVARNRFYQVPHCTGMGRNFPTTAAMARGVKAEGGWAVVSTEQCDIHWSADVRTQVRLWDRRDVPALARMTELVHRHGSLAAVELVHNGQYAANHYSREVPLAPSGSPVHGVYPVHARAMDKRDIAAFRRWHRRAALLAREAGFDIIYAYSGHDITLMMFFLAARYNRRTDEYGGSIENRARLFREVIEDTREAVGDSCALAVRLGVDELLGPRGITAGAEGRELIELLGEIPDLWDVNIAAWDNDSATSRFQPEGYQEEYISFVKSMTTKPVVGVGRFTSPDTMVGQIRRGILDFIGAARPSIADPFLPRKIEEGRIEDIRECIGCNICVAGNNLFVPMRCTQNPTQGEEWRRSWHPERIPPRDSDDAILVVGAGPAGLEAARGLGARGYEVVLAEAGRELGGRVARESRLPGLATWSRVRDYRVGQIGKMTNVSVYLASRMGAAEVREAGCSVVAVATGAIWRRDGTGRALRTPAPGWEQPHVYTPDDVMGGAALDGPVVIYDDDHYYMGGVIAEKLHAGGLDVTLVTPGSLASEFTVYTLEQSAIQRRLLELGVGLRLQHRLSSVGAATVDIACVYTDRLATLPARSVVMVTAMTSDDSLYHELASDERALAAAGIRRVTRIGDCYGPGTIAAAVYAGHRFARELGAEETDEVPFDREIVELDGRVEWPR
jgi:dimethylamine/trimethylamine dehydrogenase